jgi:hypothetical protein
MQEIDILILLTSPFKSTKFICYSNIEKQHLFHFHLHRQLSLEGYGNNTPEYMSSDIFSPQNMITGILKEKSFLCDFESKFECFLHLKYNLLHNMAFLKVLQKRAYLMEVTPETCVPDGSYSRNVRT